MLHCPRSLVALAFGLIFCAFVDHSRLQSQCRSIKIICEAQRFQTIKRSFIKSADPFVRCSSILSLSLCSASIELYYHLGSRVGLSEHHVTVPSILEDRQDSGYATRPQLINNNTRGISLGFMTNPDRFKQLAPTADSSRTLRLADELTCISYPDVY